MRLQTVKGAEGNSLVKEEFQAAMKYLVVPLIMRDVTERVARAAPTISGLPMSEVTRKWKTRTEGCYQGLVEGKWEAIPLQEAKHKAASAANQACKAVQALEKRHPEFKAPRETAKAAFADKDSILVGAGVIKDTCAAFETMQQLLQEKGKEESRAYEHVMSAKGAVQYVDQVLSAYEPSRVPFAVAMDNAGAHSMTDEKGKLQAIIPMLQVRT